MENGNLIPQDTEEQRTHPETGPPAEADPLAMYLGQIARYQLLSPAEELEIGKSIARDRSAPRAAAAAGCPRRDRQAGVRAGEGPAWRGCRRG